MSHHAPWKRRVAHLAELVLFHVIVGCVIVALAGYLLAAEVRQ